MKKTLCKRIAGAAAAVLAAQLISAAVPPIGFAAGNGAQYTFDNDLQGWKVGNFMSGNVTYSTDMDYNENGGGSAKNTYQGTKTNDMSISANSVEGIKKGKAYIVKAKIYGGTVTDGAKVYFNMTTSGDYRNTFFSGIMSEKTDIVKDEWIEISVPWVSTKFQQQLCVKFEGGSNGDVYYVDDITFEEQENADTFANAKNCNINLNDAYATDKALIINYTDNIQTPYTKTLLETGETANISAIATEGKAGIALGEVVFKDCNPESYTYKSENPEVVSVDSDGTMKAIGCGSTIVSMTDGTFSGKFVVTVVDNKDESENFVLNDDSDTFVTTTNPLRSGEQIKRGITNAENIITEIPVSTPCVASFTMFEPGVDSTFVVTQQPDGTGTKNNVTVHAGIGLFVGKTQRVYGNYAGGEMRWNYPQIKDGKEIATGIRPAQQGGWHQYTIMTDYIKEPQSKTPSMSLKVYDNGALQFETELPYTSRDDKIAVKVFANIFITEGYVVKTGLPMDIVGITPDLIYTSSGIAADSSFEIELSNEADEESVEGNIELFDKTNNENIDFEYETNGKFLKITPKYPLAKNSSYELKIKSGLRSKDSTVNVGGKLGYDRTFEFTTESSEFEIKSVNVSKNKITAALKKNSASAKGNVVAAIYKDSVFCGALTSEIDGDTVTLTSDKIPDLTGYDVEVYAWSDTSSDSITSMAVPHSSSGARTVNDEKAADSFTADYDAKNEIVTIKGQINAKRGGLPVIVRVVKKGESADFDKLLRAEEIVTAENGSVNYSFKLPKDLESGRYTVLINEPFSAESTKTEFNYIMLDDINAALAEVDKATLSNISTVFSDEVRDTLNLIDSDYDKLADKSFIYHCIIDGKPYGTDLDKFKNVYRQALKISTLLAGDTETAVNEIKANHSNEYWGISETSAYNSFIEFTSDKQKNVLTELKKAEGFKDISNRFSAAVICEDIKAQSSYNLVYTVLSKYNDINMIDYSVYNKIGDNKLKVCEYVYKNISSVNTIPELKTLFEDTAKKYQGTSGNNPGGGSGGTSGKENGSGGGSGYNPGVSNRDVTAPDWYTEKQELANRSVFSDTDSVEWAKYSINKLYNMGAISGKAEGIFAPNDKITREELCKIIVNVFGFEKKSDENAFSDVAEGMWYTDYIKICSQNNIINGIGDGLFGLGKELTREEISAILVRAADASGKILDYDISIVLPFTDEADISDWAKNSIAILRECLIVEGIGDGSFAPKANVTRAQAAKMIVGLLEYNY